MFLGGSFLGISTLLYSFPTPIAVTYDTVKIYGGNTGATVDKVRVLSNELTSTEISNLSTLDVYTWTPNTLMYAEFSNNTNAGNVQNIINPITEWRLYRKLVDDLIFQYIATYPVSQSSAIDYTVKAHREYQYRIYAANSTELSSPLDTNSVETDFYWWALVDPDINTVYLFDLNLKSGSNQANKAMKVYDNTYTEFPSVSFSQQDFLTGSVSCIAGVVDSNGSHVYPLDYLENLRSFINNGKKKILKNRHGDAYWVTTNGFNHEFVDEISQQIANISFNFTQVDSI